MDLLQIKYIPDKLAISGVWNKFEYNMKEIKERGLYFTGELTLGSSTKEM